MKIEIQIPIFMSLMLILIAQAAFSPLYLSLIFVVMLWLLFSHFRKYKADLNVPISQSVKIGLVLLALLAIYVSYGRFLGVEAGTAALAVFLFAKSLELKNKRDLIVFFNFALFVSASLFLYSQSIWMALMVTACLVSCLLGLYRIQVSTFEHAPHSIFTAAKADIGHILKFVGLAVPFFIILFLFFPRFPPLWHVPITADRGVTGISDRMSPGDIAELSQSSALAFRIIVDLKQLPAQNELYWRGMVLDQYDGTTWTSHEFNQYPSRIRNQNLNSQNLNGQNSNSPHPVNQGVAYQYLAADMRQKWVTSLEKSIPLERRLRLHQDDSMTPNRLVQSHQPFKMLWLGPNLSHQNLQLSQFETQLYTHVPKQFDKQAQALARQLFLKSQSNPELYVQNVILWYQQQNFKYSLKPGRLGEDRIDEFLFKSKLGFCEHYASSFVLLMRYVGIPARVVVGYQGGQAAPDQKSWEVRQLDAHAWTELYLNGQWKRMDPTAMIAPQRLDLGMQDYISNDQSIWGDEHFSHFKYQQFSMLKQIRIWSDYASFQWQDKVIGFDAQRQKKWMDWLGLRSIYAYAVLMIGGIFAIGLLYFVLLKLKKTHRQTRMEQILNRFSKRLMMQDQRRVGESFKAWMLRLNAHVDLEFDVSQLIQLHHDIVYLDAMDKKNLNNFENLLNRYTNMLNLNKKTCQKN